MHHELTLKETQKKWHGTGFSYAIGFFLCLILTTISFSLVAFRALPLRETILAVALLAPTQALLQLFFFLHIAQEEKPRWGLLVFVSLLVVLLIIVGGSLWIMFDLNARTMSMAM